MTATGMPAWWQERRLGIFVHATLATVPAWAPLGQYAEWYRSHLGEPVADTLIHPHPMPEVLAHHRDRWGHVERYDDFAELLDFERFDAEEWASLVREAGAGYTVFVAKHHDGWAWWDAPGSSKRLTEIGPRRNVLAEYAAACERNDIVFGTYLSLLDWGDERYPGDEYVAEALHPQALDLVERYGSALLWGDGHWGRPPDHWRTEELLARVRTIDPDVIVNDRWHAALEVPPGSPPVLRTFEYQTPDDIIATPWELTRGIGASFGHNRVETEAHHLDATGIIDLYTEVVAKGGNLLLNVGPAADGTIPDLQATPLRAAGAWIRRHDDVVSRSRPWRRWGDARVRYLDVDGDVVAIDLARGGRFPALGSEELLVTAIEVTDTAGVVHVPTWHQHPDGLRVDPVPVDMPDGPMVYRIAVEQRPERVALFSVADPGTIPLAGLLEHAAPGDIVQLGEGAYTGPAAVPAGVTLRGLGPDRTHLVAAAGAGIAPDPAVVTLQAAAHLEHVAVSGDDVGPSWRRPPVVVLDGRGATVLGSEIDGAIEVCADDAVIRATRARAVRATGADRVKVSRSTLHGNRWDVGVSIDGGSGHEIESCSIVDHLCAIRIVDATDAVVRGNRIAARWWGVRARGDERPHVHGNRIDRTMRAVDIDGGSGACVDGNAVTDGDSGCLVQGGATDTIVAGNHWQRCRAGLISWAADPLHRDNVCVDLLDPDAAHVTGP